MKEKSISVINRFTQGAALVDFMEKQYTITCNAASPSLDGSEIFIATYPKCGTTLLQQITYMMVSNGDTNFHEIGRVSPYFDFFKRHNKILSYETIYKPLFLKTHLLPKDLPADIKAICCFRSPGDAAVSFYHFLANWFFEPEAITLDNFVEEFFCSPNQKKNNYWLHFIAWIEYIQKNRALFFTYEEILNNKRNVIDKIANYLNIDKEIDYAMVEYYSSLEWMKCHKEKFNESDLRLQSPFITPDSIENLTAKVRHGKVGEAKKVLSQKSLDFLAERWESVVTPVTGWKDYQDFLAAIDSFPAPEPCHRHHNNIA